MFIPSGKKILLLDGEGKSFLSPESLSTEAKAVYENFEKIPMYLGEDLQIKTSSQYMAPFQSLQETSVKFGMWAQTAGAASSILGDKLNLDFLSKMGEGMANVSFQNQNVAFQLWKHSDPISFSFLAKFYLGIADIYNARYEVFYPSLRLMEIVLPTVMDLERGVQYMQAPGPIISDIIEMQTGVDMKVKGTNFSIKIGNMIYFERIIIKDVEVTFSHEVDSFGFPIHSNVRLSIETQRVGTTNIIRNMIPELEDETKIITEHAKNKTEQEGAIKAVGSWATSLLGV